MGFYKHVRKRKHLVDVQGGDGDPTASAGGVEARGVEQHVDEVAVLLDPAGLQGPRLPLMELPGRVVNVPSLAVDAKTSSAAAGPAVAAV